MTCLTEGVCELFALASFGLRLGKHDRPLVADTLPRVILQRAGTQQALCRPKLCCGKEVTLVPSMFLAFAFKWPSIQLAMYASYALLCRKPTMLLMEKVRSSPLTNDFVILQFRCARPARRDMRNKRMQGRSIAVRLSLTYYRPISVRTVSWKETSRMTRGDTVELDQLI